MSSSTQTKASPPTIPSSAPVPVTPLGSLFNELRKDKGKRRNLIGTNLENAVSSVLTNRVRSFLTVLGIVIGIAAVIGAITLAQGVGAYFTSAIAGLGSNTILISGSASTAQQRGAPKISQQAHPSLTVNDLQALGKLQHVEAISPVLSLSTKVVYGSQNLQTSIIGSSTDLQTIQSWQVAQGLWFNDTQDAGGDSVAVLGSTAAQNLFGPTNINPIGQQIRVGDQVFRVVGVLVAKGGSGFGASDTSVFIPYKAFQTRFTNSTYLNLIDLEVDDQSNANLAVEEVTTSLELRHHIARGTPDDFAIETAGQLLQQANTATAAISSLLGGIAAISLTVGGIGIINIMLVSVTERTREIGIRMALGARRSDIRNQFLIEALVLCIVGGIIGMLIGVFVGWLLVGVLISSIASGSGGSSVPLVISAETLLLPVGVSALVGLIFGLYPAIRASRLDPITAIRRAK